MLAYGTAALATPVAEIEEFSAWDSYLWGWRVTGVAAECHVMANYREDLQSMRFLSAYEAAHQGHGTLVRVAGINIRPHRPPTRSGKPVLFASVEDETGLLQIICAGEVIETCTPVFLLSQAIMLEGIIQRILNRDQRLLTGTRSTLSELVSIGRSGSYASAYLSKETMFIFRFKSMSSKHIRPNPNGSAFRKEFGSESVLDGQSPSPMLEQGHVRVKHTMSSTKPSKMSVATRILD